RSGLSSRDVLGPHGAALGGDPEGCVRPAIAAVVAAPLDDLEEEALPQQTAVELEKLAVRIAVIKDVLVAQARQQVGSDTEPRCEILIVVRLNLQLPEARAVMAAEVAKMSSQAKARCCVLEPKVSEMKWPAIVRLLSAPLRVNRSLPPGLSTTWLRTRPDGSRTSIIGLLVVSKIAV